MLRTVIAAGAIILAGIGGGASFTTHGPFDARPMMTNPTPPPPRVDMFEPTVVLDPSQVTIAPPWRDPITKETLS